MTKKKFTKKDIVLLSLLFAALLALNVKAWSSFEAPRQSEADPVFVAQYEWTLPLSEEYKRISQVDGVDNRFIALGPTDYLSTGLNILTFQEASSYGVIDCYGNTIVPFKYEDIKSSSRPGLYIFGNSYAQPETVMLYGLLSESGEVVIPPTYNVLMPYEGEHAIGRRGESWEVIDLAGKVVYINDSPIFASDYEGIFRCVRDDTSYLVNISTGEEIAFEGYEYMPWNVSKIEKDKTELSHEVMYHNGLYGIVKVDD